MNSQDIKMSSDNLEEQGLEKNPDLSLAQLKFLLTLDEFKNDANSKEAKSLMDGIKRNSKFYDTCFHFSFVSRALTLSHSH